MYQVFLLVAEANFPKKACSKPNGPIQAFMVPFTESYHFAAAPVRYPPTIWNRLAWLHLLASAIRLYLSSQSLGSSVSFPENSVGLTRDNSLSGAGGLCPPTPQLIPPSACTRTATFGSNPPGLFDGFPPCPVFEPPAWPKGTWVTGVVVGCVLVCVDV